jgi:hypothetical protein
MRITALLVAAHFLGLGAGSAAAVQTTDVEVDHVWILVTPRAPEAARMLEAGLSFLPDTSIHEGQGTASISTIFENAYLELLWFDGPEDPLRIAERSQWRTTGASPFGVGLRMVDTLAAELPFQTRSYHAPWMIPGTAIEIASHQDRYLVEPVFFVVPPYMSLPAALRQIGPPPQQPSGIRRLTDVRITIPEAETRSEALQVLRENRTLQFEVRDEHLLELEFDGGVQGKALDFRPGLPLVIRY